MLRYLLHTGVIPDKTHEILVPQWFGSWVYAQ